MHKIWKSSIILHPNILHSHIFPRMVIKFQMMMPHTIMNLIWPYEISKKFKQKFHIFSIRLKTLFIEFQMQNDTKFDNFYS